ncbi:MAG: DUF4471 domain-containing protein [archaeon]|nr:DUF4471 domain-containing protein [archaeon]
MEILNSIGFVNFWGVTPCMNILETNQDKLTQPSLNILISNSNDLRHFIFTIYKLFCQLHSEKEKINLPELNFYLHESHPENLCRFLLFIHLLTDRSKSIIERVEILMEIYGNTLLPSRTIEYINATYKQLISFICKDKSAESLIYNSLLDISGLTHKEIDAMVEVYASYDSKVPYDIEKYRDDRVRYTLKERYDFRKNIFDYDYNMNLEKIAPVVRLRHYITWRNTGVAFQMRVNEYKFPNRTLSCYLEGKTKTGKDSCLVRGFWADIVNSPYLAYGINLEEKEESDFFYATDTITYYRDSQDISEYNLIKILLKIDHNEHYDFMDRERIKAEQRKRAAEREEKRQRGEEIKEEEEEFFTMDKKKGGKETLEEFSKRMAKKMPKSALAQISTEEDLIAASDASTQIDTNELLQVFRDLKIKIHFHCGDIEKSIYRKKKFKNFFDIALFGFHCENRFGEHMKEAMKEDAKVLFELNTYMTSFREAQRQEYNKNLIEMAKGKGLILDDSSFKFMYQFMFTKGEEESKTEESKTESGETKTEESKVENKEEVKKEEEKKEA